MNSSCRGGKGTHCDVGSRRSDAKGDKETVDVSDQVKAAHPPDETVSHATAHRQVEAVVSIIIPVCNELMTIERVVDRVEQLQFAKELVIVDDGSTDGTAARIEHLSQRPGVRAFFHPRNLGKGAAIRTGLRHVTGSVVIIQDADLEYDPAEIERLVAPILNGQADVVYGSRFAMAGESSCRPIRRLANRGLTWFSNRLTGLALSDMETCYKAMRREVTSTFSIREDRFGVEPELTAKIARGKWRIIEMPISYRPRDYAAGKKIRFRDGLRAVWCIVRYSWRD